MGISETSESHLNESLIVRRKVKKLPINHNMYTNP